MPGQKPRYRQVLEIYEQTVGDQHPDYATTLDNLAQLYHARKEYAKAEPLLREALEITKAEGENHPDHARSLHNFSLFHTVSNDPASRVPFAYQAVEIVRLHMNRIATGQSETQRLASTRKYRHYLDGYLCVAADAGIPADKVYDEILLWKGAVTARQNAIARFRNISGALREKGPLATYDQLIVATRQLANLVRTPSGQPSDYSKKVQELSDAIESLEKKLACESAEIHRDMEQRGRTSADLRRALPANAAFIDLVEYDHFLPPDQRKDKKAWKRRLTAFLVRPGPGVVRVDLGPAAPIGAAVATWRKTFGALAAGAELRRLVWEPLAKHLEGTTAVLISPDGALTRFPFSALPGQRPNTYLIEDLAVAVVAVPQQLPELLAPARRHRRSEPAGRRRCQLRRRTRAWLHRRHLTRRGPNHRIRMPCDPGQSLPGHRPRKRRPSASGFKAPFRKVPSASFSATQPPRKPSAAWPGNAATCTSPPTATTTRRACVPSWPVHRDPARPGRPAWSTGKAWPAGIQGFFPDWCWPAPIDPPTGDRDDGILTALELGALDLRGVDLAVLSACQTAQGESPAGGEGLLGLQRAFQTAGARSVVASLWSVDDQATRQLMARFL